MYEILRGRVLSHFGVGPCPMNVKIVLLFVCPTNPL